MDSGGNSNDQLKATDSSFSGFRSQTFPNLFQGFFGVKHPTNSTTDLVSDGLEEKPSEGKSLDDIISPSNDEGWILSHYLQAKREKLDEKNLRRNVTWSELGKFDHLHLRDSTSLASSTTDVTRTERVSVPKINVTDDEGSTDELREKCDKLTKPKVVIAKNYQRSILSSFLAHDLPLSELEHSQHPVNARAMPVTASVTGEATGLGDRLDGSPLPAAATTSGDGIHESKQMLRDLLWSFNHEKINVSKKEMNLIASIDQ